ncbi:MAG TPA: hypothetical protein VKH42_11340, partial [Vicinamibacterales bacterium]|nr:hypothetical protein [Vicinamibacterales bacterium]
MDTSTVPFDGDDVYEISTSVLEEMAFWQARPANTPPGVTPAICTMKTAVLCPNCGQSIKSVHVVGLAGAAKDSGVRGLVVTCPECESSVPPEIAGL